MTKHCTTIPQVLMPAESVGRDDAVLLMARPRDTSRTVWIVAFLLAIMLHLAVILGVRVVRPFSPTAAHAGAPEPISLVFAPSAVPEDEPSFFSELPPDRADAPPDRPDFLSNVDSRAKDLVDGDEDYAMPRLDGSSEAPHVRMDRGADGRAVSEQAENPSELPSDDSKALDAQDPAAGLDSEVTTESRTDHEFPQEEHQLQDEAGEALPVDRTMRDARRDTREPVSPRRKPSLSGMKPTSPGTVDLFQEEMFRPEGNTALSGSVSLNTIAWDYAPWLQRFSRDLERRWYAPVAYYMGIIHGWTHVELTIAPDGALRRLVVLGENGHESLRQTSVAVLNAMAPYHPLPESFPEDSLILRIKLIYPSLRRGGR